MKTTVDKILEFLLICILCIMLVAVIWQVVSRYLVASPSTFTDEIASFSMIWLGLLGAAYTAGKKLHLAIDLLSEQHVGKYTSFYENFVRVVILGFALLVMVVGGLNLCHLTYLLDQRSAVLEVRLAYVYGIIPFSGLLIIFYTVHEFIAEKTS